MLYSTVNNFNLVRLKLTNLLRPTPYNLYDIFCYQSKKTRLQPTGKPHNIINRPIIYNNYYNYNSFHSFEI